jgi:tubulin alpha
MDLVIPFDNQSLYSAAHNHLDIEAPGFQDINRVIAQVQSAVSLSMREQAQPLNVNFRDLLTNLVCYPRIHYLYPSLAGLPGDIRSPSISSID